MRYAVPFILLLLVAGPASAQDLQAALAAALPGAVQARHAIHAHPELSNREEVTAALVADRLRELGIEVRTGVAHTGVVGVLRGGRPGATVAVRADMDALPVQDESGLPFASTVTSSYQGKTVPVHHACGHDIHTSVQLGLAAMLAGVREQLPGTVVFVFQPAEEGPPSGEEGGAALMLEEGVFDGLEPGAIFALHSEPLLPVGQVGWTSGPAMASSDTYVARIHGRQAHGARPELSIDPVVTAAQAVLALQTIVSRNVAPLQPAVLSVGIIEGGLRSNIIPAEVRLEGTVRTYDQAVRELIERRIHEVLGGVTQAAGATYELDYRSDVPPTINDPALSAWVRPVLEEELGAANVLTRDPAMAAEDFAWFALRYPAFYLRLGTEDPDHPSGPLHTPTFRAADAAIGVGMRAMGALVVTWLDEHAE